ncbi:MAG: Unknown protein [uncultured Sulfurovum sp.]|uniref:Uncharacterized protein n=1 Tax=uncultured Sulfurovum sp. TaxID=269237 RepID=A0A6S6RTL6_9BACT|nr:MAG: Unknown protein [uncultured Sulfurovum sp.]
MNYLHIKYERGLSFPDVIKKIPRITKENEVYHDGSIVFLKLQYKEKILGELFYDEQSNHYCYDPKFDSELQQTVGDTLRDEYHKQHKNMEHILERIDENIFENPDINFLKIFNEKEYFFNFTERNFSDGIDKYVKILASNHQEAIHLMLNSHYANNYFESYNKQKFIEKYALNKHHCIDVFSQNDKDFILMSKNEYGYDEKVVLDRNEVYDLAYKIFVEDGDEGSEITEVSRVNLESAGESEALNILREYSDYEVEDVGKDWNILISDKQFNMKSLDEKEIEDMNEDELLFILKDSNYKVLKYANEFKVEGRNERFNTIRQLSLSLNKEAETVLNNSVDDDIRRDK